MRKRPSQCYPDHSHGTGVDSHRKVYIGSLTPKGMSNRANTPSQMQRARSLHPARAPPLNERVLLYHGTNMADLRVRERLRVNGFHREYYLTTSPLEAMGYAMERSSQYDSEPVVLVTDNFILRDHVLSESTSYWTADHIPEDFLCPLGAKEASSLQQWHQWWDRIETLASSI